MERLLEDKEPLIDADPDKFFTMPHYVSQLIALVRLERVNVDESKELIADSGLPQAPPLADKRLERRRGETRAVGDGQPHAWLVLCGASAAR